MNNPKKHLRAVLQALLVTFLWSTSWVLIKIGLEDIPALPFAGLRYVLACVVLLPIALWRRQPSRLPVSGAGGWGRLILLGILYYAVTQGAIFWALFYLPSVTVSLLWTFTPILVALLGIPLLSERPTLPQWGGIGLFLTGALVYFYPAAIPAHQGTGLIIAGVGVLANALSSVLGRQVNRESGLDPLTITVISMGAGALLLLVTGILVQGLPRLSLTHWAIIGWLAVVNSAAAFTLWNHTLRTLSATESSIINNTMLIQIAVLAWLFLGEGLTARQIGGMLLAGAGILIVHLYSARRKAA